jgi:hypothetical protein
MSDYFFPKLMAVVAVAPYRLRSTWSTGEVLEVDVETRLRKHAVLAAILDPEVFTRVHIGEWMHHNDLSLSTAAEALGISRRMVSYYRTAHKAIPRTIWLACLGWEATRPQARTLPRALPTAREYAASHA